DRAGQLYEQPDADELQRAEQPTRKGQQTQHDEAKTQVVHFGQRVQTRERVRETQQPDRARHEEESAGEDRQNGESIERGVHRWSASPVRMVARVCEPDAPPTKATDANAESNASINATSTADGVAVATASRSNTAPPPVPMSCAAIMRSASAGPSRMRSSPSATIASTKPAAPNRMLATAMQA